MTIEAAICSAILFIIGVICLVGSLHANADGETKAADVLAAIGLLFIAPLICRLFIGALLS